MPQTHSTKGFKWCWLKNRYYKQHKIIVIKHIFLVIKFKKIFTSDIFYINLVP